MRLPFFNKKTSTTENYFGIFLQEGKVTGYVYELTENKIELLAQHSATFSNGMDNIVEDIDDILFRLETDTNKKLSKTIFFVTSQYLDKDTKQIKKEFKPVIKKITQELELQAMGFIECFEAVAALLSKKEGVHLNMVLVELGETTGNLFIYKNDKQVYASEFSRTEKLVDDLNTVLTETKKSFMLPSRIVFYPYSHTQKEIVHLVNHSWSNNLFVHAPKIESLSEDDLHIGLSEIFYTQLKDDSEIPKDSMTINTSEEDYKLDSEPLVEKHVESEPHQKEVMGFVVGDEGTFPPADQEEIEQAEPIKPSSAPSSEIKPFFLTTLINKIKTKPGGIKVPLKFPIIIVVAVLFVLCTAFVGAEYFLHKEVVKVSFPTKDIQSEETVVNSDLDIKTGSVSANLSDSVITTGKKDVGDKAKGEVTIRSFDDKDKTIGKGTTLEVESKKFLLDQDVKVASASMSSDNSTKIAGQVKANVTADTIGPEYNLEKNKKFRIGDLDFSTFFAINDDAFTGGSKKLAQTVAKKDIEDLRTKVLAAGKKQGLDKMRAEVSRDQQILDKLTVQELEEVDFSKEVGDEAKTVSVKAKVTTTYYTYSQNDLRKLLQETMKEKLASGYTLPLDKITVSITKAVQEKNKITLSVSATGKSIKQISKEDVVSSIKGTGKSGVSDLLKTRFGAVDAQLEDQGLSFFPWMPLFKKNITIEINSL